MYELTSFLCEVFRFFFMPNTFELALLFEDLGLFGMLFGETIIIIATFSVVSLYYQKGKCHPAIGSILYLIFYIIHIGLIKIMSSAGFNLFAVIPLLLVYIAVHIGLFKLKKLMFSGVH